MRWSTLVVADVHELTPYVPAWESLAAAALEPNIFYEPWMMLPALRALAGSTRLRFVLIFGQAGDDVPTLCGFFPLEYRPSYHRLPVSVLRTWIHEYGPLGTPLIRTGLEDECLREFFRWSARHGSSLIEFSLFPSGGPFHRALLAANPRSLIRAETQRALFRRGADADDYLQAALSRDQRKSLRRKARRLAENGPVELRHLGPDDDLESWLADFLRLESSGWKGRQGTAQAQDPAKRAFLEDACRNSFRLGRLRFAALRVQDRAIAYQIYFTAATGAFAWKTTYDEAYSQFSPGLLIQTELIEHWHRSPEFDWIDSTSEPGSYLNEVWKERLALQTLLVGTGWTGRLVVSGLKAVLRLKARLQPPNLSRDVPRGSTIVF
jgi:hypothetical protein